jgi:hypothetical protein
MEVETRIELLLPKVSVSALSCTAGKYGGHGKLQAVVELVIGISRKMTLASSSL